jgi:hypothetical protein
MFSMICLKKSTSELKTIQCLMSVCPVCFFRFRTYRSLENDNSVETEVADRYWAEIATRSNLNGFASKFVSNSNLNGKIIALSP